MNPEPHAETSTDVTAAAAESPPPGTAAKGIAFGLLWLGLVLAAVVVVAMAANAASATGGCGGG